MSLAEVYQLCQNGASVSSELAKDPSASPASICKKLYGRGQAKKTGVNSARGGRSETPASAAFDCGRWGSTRPSDLFLTMYADVLKTLEHDPLNGVCSPSLLGTNGVCPLTVMATIPDVCRHMSNLIVRAEREVFIATNYWQKSESSMLLSNAIRELSRRCVAEGKRVVVKVLYDRGSLKQLIEHHVSVAPKEFSDADGPIALPHPSELPNVDLEVVNYHQPVLGTFHAKFMIVDRRIAILQSNNIMDNDNLEMMSQYEGDIVDSIYDMAIVTWHKELKPALPCLKSPATGQPTPTFASTSFRSLFEGSHASSSAPLQQIATRASDIDMPQHTARDPHYDSDIASEVLRTVASLHTKNDERRIDSVSRLLNGPSPGNQSASAPDLEPHDMITPLIPIAPHEPFPMAMVNRPPHGTPNLGSLNTPQNAAFLSAFRNAKTDVFIQTPDLNAQDLVPEIIAACRRGVQVTYYYCLGYNDAGELLPQQGGHNEMVASKLYAQLEEQYRENLKVYAYTAKDQVSPIHNKFKKRSCHIKLMIVDGHVGVQGSGNQDTQSWYHSQEANVMIDSETVCAAWMQGIKQNQNTHVYGRVASNGEHAGNWVDEQTGEACKGAIGADPGHFAWAKGAIGAFQRVRGKGGF